MVKYPYLHADLNLKSRYEEIEEISSYVHDLPEEAQAWMNSFVAEYVCADFRHGGEVVNTTKEDRRECWSKNNNRNRCIYNKEKSYGSLNYIEDMSNSEIADNMVVKNDYILQLDDAEFDESTETGKKKAKNPNSTLPKRK